MRRKRVLVIQPSLQPPGGGNGVCNWILQSLRDDYDLGVLSWYPVDLGPINTYYGTDLRPSDCRFFLYPQILRRFWDGLPFRLARLKSFLLVKRSRRIQPGFDVPISVNNETDFGRRGIQYIHFPWNYFPRPDADTHWYHSAFLGKAYYILSKRAVDYCVPRMQQNVTLVNSDWIGAMVRGLYPGIRTRTLYPPIQGEFPDIPWKKRESGFVCLGRISPEKETDKIIRILQAVRREGFDIHLHIVGTRDNDVYYDRIKKLIHQNTTWVKLDEWLPRRTLFDLIASHRYGIHGMPEEHFGMAVAEMVKAGSIVFLPDGGGQVEIVARHDPLLYRSEKEAAAKIRRVLTSAEEQARLRAFLEPMRRRFSLRNFIQEARDIVRGFLSAPAD